MLIGSTVSPFIITEILHKWILTTFHGEQSTVVVGGVCVCICVHVCVFKMCLEDRILERFGSVSVLLLSSLHRLRPSQVACYTRSVWIAVERFGVFVIV